MDKLKIGILVMLVGIAMIGMMISSVAVAEMAHCKINAGGGISEKTVYGNGNTAKCYLSNICGFYDGYANGQMGNGWSYSTGSVDCWADAEQLWVTSYSSSATIQKWCC